MTAQRRSDLWWLWEIAKAAGASGGDQCACVHAWECEGVCVRKEGRADSGPVGVGSVGFTPKRGVQTVP